MEAKVRIVELHMNEQGMTEENICIYIYICIYICIDMYICIYI